MLNNMHLIISALKRQDTDAVVLGGSHCIGLQDTFSDIDICIYYNNIIDIQKLNEALSEIDDEHAKGILLPLNSWGIWQNSDGVCILGGKEYDITLRNLSFVEKVIKECISGNIYCMHNPAYPYGYCNSYLIGEMDNCHTLYAASNRLSHLQRQITENKDRICNSVVRSFLEDAIFQCICGLKAELSNDIPYRNAALKNGAFSLLNVYAAQKKYCYSLIKELNKEFWHPINVRKYLYYWKIFNMLFGYGRENWIAKEMWDTLWARLSYARQNESFPISEHLGIIGFC